MPASPEPSAASPHLDGNFFVCVGAQKAATTWLYHAFERHPDVWVPLLKEVHYFDEVWTGHNQDVNRHARLRLHVDWLTKWEAEHGEVNRKGLTDLRWLIDAALTPIRDDAWYCRLMSAGENHAAYGELTPDYSIISQQGFEHIRRLAPDVKILFIMRNPKDRIWSHLRMDAKISGDTSALEDPKEAIRRIKLPGPYWNRTDYPATLARLDAVFGGDQVLTMFHEDIAADPEPVLRRVAEFLGVAPHPKMLEGAHEAQWVSESWPMPARVAAFLDKRCRRLVRDVESAVGRVPDAWGRPQ